MSNVQIYSKGVVVDDISGDKTVFKSINEVSVELKDVDAGDFTSEFTVDEILRTMEFSDVVNWVTSQLDEE